MVKNNILRVFYYIW